jgi:hypothetical protein
MVYKIVVAFLLSSVKYALGVAWCMARFDNHYLSFFVTLLGGATGVVVFTYFGHVIQAWWAKFRKKKKVFSKTNRRLVWLRNYGGLGIVALLSPIIISIPGGCLLASTFVHSRKKILLYMFASLLLWSVAIFGALELFKVDLTHWFD